VKRDFNDRGKRETRSLYGEDQTKGGGGQIGKTEKVLELGPLLKGTGKAKHRVDCGGGGGCPVAETIQGRAVNKATGREVGE